MAKYNPYNSYKNVLDLKADWHTAQQLGQDPSQYALNATRHYRDLVDNGYETLADELYRSDYITAKDLADKYGLKPDEDLEIDNFMNQATGTGTNGTASAARAYGTDPSTQKLLDQGIGAGEDYRNFMNQTRGIATGEIGTKPSETVDDMLNAWGAGNDRLNGEIRYDDQGNVISGLNTAHYNIGREQLDRINNFDVTKQPYYQGIMDQYKLGGYNAAQGAYANGAADNGGNIDSYAAANANRQQLAFTTAGQQAALAAAQQNANNWQNLYAQMSQDLNNQGVLNANTLQQAAQMYAVDAEERMNALDVAGAMERQAMANAIQGYLGNIQADMQKYGIDAETAMNSENNRAALEQITAQLAAQERMNTENNETTRLGYASQERMNTENNQTQRYGYDTNRDIADINANAQLGVAGINRDATLGAAGINRDATLGSAQIAANSNLARAQMDYDLGLAGLQNALDVVDAQSRASAAQTEAAKKYEQEYLQMLLDNGLLPQGVTMQNPGTGKTPGANNYGLDAIGVAQGLFDKYQSKDPSLPNVTDVYAALAQLYDNDTTNPYYAQAVAWLDQQFANNKKYGVTTTNDILSQLGIAP